MPVSIETLARWVFGLASLFNATIMARELLTRPNRDVWVEQLGSVVSLQSIYLGAVVVSIVVFIACVFPVFRWVWDIPVRRQEHQRAKLEQEHEKSIKKQAEVIKIITDLKELLGGELGLGSGFFSSEKETRILLHKRDLISKSVAREMYRDAPNTVWRAFFGGCSPIHYPTRR